MNTQMFYLQQVSLFARHFNKPPGQLGPEEIRASQVYLTNEKKLTPDSVLIAVAALRFLYWVSMIRNWQFDEVIPAPKKPRKLPVVLNAEEQFLVCSIESTKHRAILTPCYAAGMYISEAVFLKIDDTDSQRMVIRVNQAKGQKDRYVMLSPHAEDPAHMVASEEAPPLDLSRRLPRFLGLDAHGETNAITVAEPDAVGRNWKADQDLGIQRSGKDLPARFTLLVTDEITLMLVRQALTRNALARQVEIYRVEYLWS